MYRLHIEREIAVSHQLTLHEGKCKNLHGHNLKVEVDLESADLQGTKGSSGMLTDFGAIKSLIDELDHKHLNDFFRDMQTKTNSVSLSNKFYCLSIQPTAERLAEYFVYRVKNLFPLCEDIKVKVRVHEATNQWAEYEE